MSYTLQILSFYGESGLLGTQTAPILGAMVEKLKTTYANTITLGEGDTYIPGPWLVGGADPSLNAVPGIGTTALGRPDIAIFNAIGVNASALGNHEFDLNSSVLQGAITASGTGAAAWVGAQFPFVTDNLDFSADSFLRANVDNSIGGTSGAIAGQEASTLNGKIVPYTIVTINGQRIGIVGSTTFELLTKSSPSGTRPYDDNPNAVDANDIQEAAAKVQGAVNALTALGVNKIIEVDQLDDIQRTRAVANLVSGVDVWVAGGGHERLADSTDRLAAFNGHDATAYPGATYPLQTTGADGKVALIVTTDTEYTYTSRLVVDFNAAGDIVVGSLNPAINGAYASNEATLQAVYGSTQTAAQIVASSATGTRVKAISDAIGNVIASKDGTVFGYTNVYLEGDRVFGRAQEVNLGDITADANLFKASLAVPAGTFMTSLKNGGGIRSSIGTIDDNTFAKIAPEANPTYGKQAGAISQLDIENALRFDNKLMVFDTTPQGLKNILEYGVTLPAGNGGYSQLGGIRVAYDPAAAAGNRVTSISLIDIDNNVIARVYDNGQVLAGAPATISMACLSFTANGGDGYPIKANASNFRYLKTDGTLSGPVTNTALDFTADATLATVGLTNAGVLGEQRAFADFLQAKYYDQAHAYSVADTGKAGDLRIEDLGQRYNAVFEGVNRVGSAAADAIQGTVGDDSIQGGAGNDTVAGGVGRDNLDGGLGNDQLFGGADADVLTGGAGDDTLYGGAGNDIMIGGTGNDSAVIEDAGDTFVENLGEGTDTAFVLVNGWTAGANIETIRLYGAATQVTGSFGADTLVANATLGSIIDGGAGNDTIYGQAGNDSLSGGAGDDLIYGGAGNDTLTGGPGNDTMGGGTGDDTYFVDDAGDVVGELAGEGNDVVFVSVSNWVGGDNIETVNLVGTANLIYATNGNATFVANALIGSALIGGIGNDQFTGAGLNDTLVGGAGNDILRGNGGNDVLIGGAGNDQLFGGAGADLFGFNAPGSGFDQIFDFSRAEGDRFDMRGSGVTSFAQLSSAIITSPGVPSYTVVSFGDSRFDVYGFTGLQASDFIFS